VPGINGTHLGEFIGNRRLRLVATARFLSSTASAAFLAILPWYATKTGGAQAAATALTALAVGRGLATLAGGAMADRLPKGALITLTELARAGALMALAALSAVVREFPAMGWAAFAGTLGLLSGIASPSSSTIIADCVQPNQIAEAVAIIQALLQAASMLGPSLGGLLASTDNQVTSSAVLAVCYFAAGASMFSAKIKPPAGRSAESVFPGFRFVAQHVDVLLLVVAALAANTLTAPLDVLLAVYFKGSPGHYGLSVSVWGVGMVVGASLLAWRPFALDFRLRLAWLSMVGMGLLQTMMGVATTGVVPVILMGTIGLISGPVSASLLSYVLSVVPSELRGRVVAATQASSMAATPLAFALTGALARKLAAHTLMEAGGVALTVITVALFILFQVELKHRTRTSGGRPA
jgi:MFS family permease